MRVIAYARVSTNHQSIDIQQDEIEKFCKFRNFDLVRFYSDKASGKNTDRPGFQKMLKDLEHNPLSADALVIYKLDRVGRSLLDLMNIAHFLEDHGIGLISITNSIDTTTKEGRLFFYIMGALAEYERELINERTLLGLRAVQAKGIQLGRRRKPFDVKEAMRLRADGVPVSRICKRFGIGRTTYYKRMQEIENELSHVAAAKVERDYPSFSELFGQKKKQNDEKKDGE